MDERTVDLDGRRLTYRVGGRGPAVVLTHALGPVAWGRLDVLVDACTVLVPDWERSALGDEARASFGWLVPLLETHGHARGTLCVWSMSGPAAIDYAAEQPAELAGLVLVDVAGFGEGFPALKLRHLLHVVWSRIRGRPTRGYVRMLMGNWIRRDDLDTRELEAAMHRFLTRGGFGPPDGADTDDDENGEQDDPFDVLRGIAVPTWVLAGRHSTVLGVSAAERMVGALRRGRSVVFEHSSHALQLEEPGKFQRVVAELVTGAAPH